MEGDGIDTVLRRATELRLKINNCIHQSTTSSPSLRHDFPSTAKENGVLAGAGSGSEIPVSGDGEADDDEVERLLNIWDALESLETQLSSLQVLHQQQRYEMDTALSEIERGREMLLQKLKDYKGVHSEVISEASAFVGEAVEHNQDLMLPPYPSHPPYSLRPNNSHLPQSSSARQSVRNGIISSHTAEEARDELIKPLTTSKQSSAKNSLIRIGPFLAAAAKTVVTIVGVVSMLSLSGFRKKFAKRGVPLKMFGFLQQPTEETERQRTVCPPGKILVVEDGEARCLVKERVEVPFSSAMAKPDVNYGWG